MKNKLKKFVLACLLMALAFTCLNASALAANEWYDTQIEQTSVVVPNVDVYLYPTDRNNNVISGLTKNDFDARMQLDSEELEIDTVESAEKVGTAYIVMVNLSVYATKVNDLPGICGGLSKWVGELKENDKFVLISYTDSVTVQLDGTESRDSAKRMIGSLKTEDKNSDPVAALKEAIRVAETDEIQAYPRRALVLYDCGRFLGDTQESETSLLLNSLKAAGLPLYMLYNYNFNDVPEKARDFTGSSGGRSFACTGGSYQESMTDDLRVWLNSAYHLVAHSQSNAPTPELRTLKLTLGGAEKEQEFQYEVKVKGNVQDNSNPVIEELYFNDDDEIVIRFSENVKGAENKKNYYLLNQKNEEEIAIEDIEYDEATFSAVIELEEKAPDSEYSLRLQNVTDCSYEENPLELPDGDAYNFVKGEGSTDWSWLYIVAAAVLVLIVILVIVLVFRKKINKQKAENERELRNIKDETGTQLQQMGQDFDDYKTLPLELTIISPTGFESKASVSLKDGEDCVVGRSARLADIVIQDDPTVSKEQLVLVYKDKKLIAVDAGSTNDTYVNDEMIKGQYQLKDKDVITVGRTTIVVKY